MPQVLLPRTEERWTPEKQARWDEIIEDATWNTTIDRLEHESQKASEARKARHDEEYRLACAQRTRAHFVEWKRKYGYQKRDELLTDTFTGLVLVKPVPSWWWNFVDSREN